jgi:hypothetical protein
MTSSGKKKRAQKREMEQNVSTKVHDDERVKISGKNEDEFLGCAKKKAEWLSSNKR